MKQLQNFTNKFNELPQKVKIGILAVCVILMIFFAVKIQSSYDNYKLEKANKEVLQLQKSIEEANNKALQYQTIAEDRLQKYEALKESDVLLIQKLQGIDSKLNTYSARINSDAYKQKIDEVANDNSTDLYTRCTRACAAADEASGVTGENYRCSPNFCDKFSNTASAKR